MPCMQGWIDVASGEVAFDYVSSFVNHFLTR